MNGLCGAPMTDAPSTLHCDLPAGHPGDWHEAPIGSNKKRKWQLRVCHRCYRQGASHFETVFVSGEERFRCSTPQTCDERARIGRLGIHRSYARSRR